jgi:hypothetical protein
MCLLLLALAIVLHALIETKAIHTSLSDVQSDI